MERVCAKPTEIYEFKKVTLKDIEVSIVSE
jgi:hypothetical protein